MATQGDIARHLGLDVSSVNKILHHKPGAKFRKATVDQVFRAARKLGFRVEALKHAHRRADPRLKVRIFCGITLYRESRELFEHLTALAIEGDPAEDADLKTRVRPPMGVLQRLHPEAELASGAEDLVDRGFAELRAWLVVQDLVHRGNIKAKVSRDIALRRHQPSSSGRTRSIEKPPFLMIEKP